MVRLAYISIPFGKVAKCKDLNSVTDNETEGRFFAFILIFIQLFI